MIVTRIRVGPLAEKPVNITFMNFPMCWIWRYAAAIAMCLIRGGVEQNPGPGEEQSPRFGHVTTVYNNMLYIWGGKPADRTRCEKSEFISAVNVFDILKKTWTTHYTGGALPIASERCAHTTYGSCLYVYGGYDWSSTKHDNSLHKLDLETLCWTKMPFSADNNPGKKASAGLACQMDMLVLFGGFGFSPDTKHEGAIYVENEKYFHDHRGWTNDLYAFSFSEGKWQFKPSDGTPPPSNGFSFISYGEKYIFKYGGTEPRQKCVTRMNILDVTTWVWREINMNADLLPQGRSFHSSSAYAVGDNMSLVITGGEYSNKENLSDMWAFNFLTETWAQVELPAGYKIQRRYHSACCYSLPTSKIQVLIFGGLDIHKFPLAEIKILELEGITRMFNQKYYLIMAIATARHFEVKHFM